MKKVIVIASVLIALVLLIPFPAKMKDGGTVHYNAVLYDVYDMHRIKPVENPLADGTFETEYIEGIIVEIFGIEVFNNTNPRVDY